MSDQLAARRKANNILLQGVFFAAVVFLIYGAVRNAQINLEALGLTNGFGFLERSTGWSYSFSLIERSIDDSYAQTLTIGLMNTLFLGVLAIITTTVFGFIIGTLRDSGNLALQAFASIYVNIFRNLPLILQLVFWYAIFIHLPGPRQAISFGDVAFLSNRGLKVTTLNIDAGVALVAFLAALALAILVIGYLNRALWQRLLLALLGTVVIFVGATLLYAPEGEPFFSVPSLQGLRFRGGVPASVELMAMITSITLYGSAYIAEVVRGGLKEVPKGLTEAGHALGLSDFAIWWNIKLPMALRSIIPPLGNQWIFMMKATTIGVAIGFSDLFMIVSTSITQSGQTLELIFLLMAAFVIVNFTLAQLINWMNHRMQLKAH